MTDAVTSDAQTSDAAISASVPNASLIRDLLSWLAEADRPYDEVMAAWRSSCPRLTIWEDALDLGLVELFHEGGRAMVRPSPKGMAFLDCR